MGGREAPISASGLLELLSFTVASVQKILSQYPSQTSLPSSLPPTSPPLGDSGTTAISTRSPLADLRVHGGRKSHLCVQFQTFNKIYFNPVYDYIIRAPKDAFVQLKIK